MKEHPATVYNRVKSIVFSRLNRDGIAEAYKFLDSQRGTTLPIPAWFGLKAELDFYTGYKDVYTLDPTLDFGIKCDFVGDIDGCERCRIDVTTNINFKRYKEYESIQQKDHRKYKIVLMNKDNGKIEDVFDLNFIPDNFGGRLFDVALFMPMEYGHDGDPKYNYYQRILTISSTTQTIIEEKEIVTDWYIPDILTKKSDIYEEYEGYDDDSGIEETILKKDLAETAKFLSKSTDYNIVACAQTSRIIINPHTCEEEERTQIYWKHPVIQDMIDDIIYEE